MILPKNKADQVGRLAAVAVGLIWVCGPVFPVMFGVPALAVLLAGEQLDKIPMPTAIAILPPSFTVGFVAAWAWWSFMAPRWRLWAFERVADIEALKAAAVKAGIIWPDGHFFERTEFRPSGYVDRLREIESGKRKK